MFRYMFMIIAIATAVSAAEIPMANIAKKKPSNCSGKRKRLNTAKFISTEFKISSIDIRIANRFLRVKKPYIPANIMIVETIR